MKYTLLVLFAVCFVLQLSSQTYDFGVVKGSTKSVHTMMRGNVVQGYYAYHLPETVEEDYVFDLFIFDINMKLTHHVELNREKFEVFQKLTYNGVRFCCSFLIYSATYRHQILSKEGEKVKEFSSFSIDLFQSEGCQIIGVEGTGFVVTTTRNTSKKGTDCGIKVINNNGEEVLNFVGTVEAEYKFNEIGSFLFANSDYALISVKESVKNYNPKWVHKGIKIFDLKTGDLIKFIDSKEGNRFYHTQAGTFDRELNCFLISGEVYGLNWKGAPIRSDKKDVFIRKFDLERGVIHSFLTSSIVGKGKSVTSENELQFGMSNLIFHEIFGLKNGKIYVIGEHFKRSGVKITNGLTSLGLFIIEFNNELELIETIVVKKPKSTHRLSYDTRVPLSMDKLALAIKDDNGFDFSYVSISQDNERFIAAYQINNRGVENNDRKHSIGIIANDEDGEIVNLEFDIDAEVDDFKALPAKPGFVGVIESIHQKKWGVVQLSMKLIRIDI